MSSKNVSSADNQQERLKFIGWITGFVDGEGCFSVSIFRNKKAGLRTGWQVFPEFVITQGEKSLSALEEVKDFFGCGNIFINRSMGRNDNHREPLHRYCVRSLNDLKTDIIPFFLENQLRSAKKKDFEKFVRIIKLIEEKQHLERKGLIKIAKIMKEMNRKVPSKFLVSSEAIRRDRR